MDKETTTSEALTWGLYDVYYYVGGHQTQNTDKLQMAAVNAAIARLEKNEGLVAVCISQGDVPVVVAGWVPK